MGRVAIFYGRGRKMDNFRSRERKRYRIVYQAAGLEVGRLQIIVNEGQN